MTLSLSKTILFSSLLCGSLFAQQEPPHIEPPPGPPEPLSSAALPPVPGLMEIVRDPTWAIVLGKSLFWDQQAGSDGNSCGTCHYHAGADHRFKNQISPSLLTTVPGKAGIFDPMPAGPGGTNYELQPEDFPLHRLADPTDRDSMIVYTTDDVVSSMGVFRSRYIRNSWNHVMFDDMKVLPDPIFCLPSGFAANAEVTGRNTRRVEPRNTPTTINAAFQFDLFWDGRAKNSFNGQNPFGRRDNDAEVLQWNGRSLTPKKLALRNAALASQAVAPVLSTMEMSSRDRLFTDVAEKLLPRQALQFQEVKADDSVLGPHVDSTSGLGLNYTYEELIKLAFRTDYWDAPPTRTSSNGDIQIVHNFAMFWGLSIMMYEQTQIADQTRFDDFVSGRDPNALTAQELRGLDVFIGQGRCILCHKGPDLSGAGFILQAEHQEGGLVERMNMGDGRIAVYDNGFYNIGVTPTAEDIGRGANDVFGNPLSWSRQWLNLLNHGEPLIDRFEVVPATFEVLGPVSLFPTMPEMIEAFANDPEANDGAFKTPGLMNVELTGPYMHNGSMSTLEQVVEFYNRGGNVRSDASGGDSSGFDGNPSNLAPDIEPLGLDVWQQADLIAFLKSLTDERVRMEMAPFDHPSVSLPEGHSDNEHPQFGNVAASDLGRILPAVGAGGRQGMLPPLQPFHVDLEARAAQTRQANTKPTTSRPSRTDKAPRYPRRPRQSRR